MFILKFISISKMKILWQIENFLSYYGFKLIKNKRMFLFEGKKTFNLRIFINDTYECIQSIENAHDDNIFGFVKLNDRKFASFSWWKNKNSEIIYITK